jgi:hypothetical protein
MLTKISFHTISCMIRAIQVLDVKLVLHPLGMKKIFVQEDGPVKEKLSADCMDKRGRQ